MTNRKRLYRRRKALQGAMSNLKKALQVRTNMMIMGYGDHRILEQEKKTDEAIRRYEIACRGLGIEPDWGLFIEEEEEVEVEVL